MNNSKKRPSKWFPNNEWILLVALALEIVIFARYGDNFFTVDNAFEITRLAVEVGLIALGMTMVIKTSGIDLSVGSIMAMVVVVVGMLWKDAALNIWVASAIGLGVASLAGLLNGVIITRIQVPPLIVTLATMSLFRGIAEAITGGYTIYTGFPDSFMFIGTGYIMGVVPTQLPIFIVVGVVYWIMSSYTVFGRRVTAVGFNTPGSVFAGIPTAKLLCKVYVLCGLTTGVAALIYMSHIGQAKANAGAGYELLAITAVVLGGASITGGKGTVFGTILGVFCLNTLQNGMRLSGHVSELAEMLIGCILIATLLIKLVFSRLSDRSAKAGSV